MKKFKFIFYLSLLLAIALIFFYRASIFNYFSPRLASFEKTAVNTAVEEVRKQVNTPPPLVVPKKTSTSTATVAAKLTIAGTIKWTNTERRNNGALPPLAENSELDEIAALRLADMFKNQYFAHVSPTGSSAESVAKEVGYDYIALGENLALGDFSGDEDLVTAWMNSPGHRANILNTKYQEIGVAVKEGNYAGHSAWIGVQIFGKPASSCPAVDDTLKAKIDAGQNELQSMQNNLQTLKAEIDNINLQTSGERTTYDQDVDQYNQLVASYNTLVVQVKDDVSAYNGEVAAFNQCLNE